MWIQLLYNKKEHPADVTVPSFDDILGDKLTAFAPNTTGIPYQKSGNSQTMEIIKQLYDIGYLFDSAEDLSVVSKTFNEYVDSRIWLQRN